VARQSQIITNIVELAKTMKKHPGNVISPFFEKITSQPEQLSNFNQGVDAFVAKVAARAIVKRKEMDEAASQKSEEDDDEEDAVDLNSIPREQRLGPGGLDPLEVFETLPLSMQEAFESREVERLKEALLQMDPKDAEYHMQRYIDLGL
jgi:cell division cycle protein 37